MKSVYTWLALCATILLVCCQPSIDQTTVFAEDYAVYSIYLTSFQFYKNLPRSDTVIIYDSTSIHPAAINVNTPWSWVADKGDQCCHGNNAANCQKAESSVWEPLFAEIKQQPYQPRRKLEPVFTLPFSSRSMSKDQAGRLLSKDESGTATYAFRLSPVAYNAARTKALFFSSFACGGTCGREELVMLEKVNQYWVIIDTFRFGIA